MKTPALLPAGPANPAWTLILAHGAGQGMDSPFMDAFAEGLARRGERLGGLRTVRFEFPYMERARREGKKRPPDREPILLDSWRTVITALLEQGSPRERLLIGGKSMGGRMATLIADEQSVNAYPRSGPVHRDAPVRLERERDFYAIFEYINSGARSAELGARLDRQ